MFRHNIDSILIRGNTLVLIGWGFLQGGNVTRLTLQLSADSEASYLEFEVEYGLRRDDVKMSFSNIPEAENSGFFLFAGFGQKRITHALLQWEIDEKEMLETPIEFLDSKKRKPIDVIKHSLLSSKAWKLIRTSGLIALVHKARVYISARPKSAHDSQWNSLYAKLKGQRLTVIIDHDMGGWRKYLP